MLSADGTTHDVVVTITGTNDAPVATDDAVDTTENTVLNSNVPVATDIDGTIASYALGGTNVAEGSLLFNPDGTYSFDPGTDFDDLDLGCDPRCRLHLHRARQQRPAERRANHHHNRHRHQRRADHQRYRRHRLHRSDQRDRPGPGRQRHGQLRRPRHQRRRSTSATAVTTPAVWSGGPIGPAHSNNPARSRLQRQRDRLARARQHRLDLQRSPTPTSNSSPPVKPSPSPITHNRHRQQRRHRHRYRD